MNLNPKELAADWEHASEGGKCAKEQLGSAATATVLLFVGAKIIEELVSIKSAIERLETAVRTPEWRR